MTFHCDKLCAERCCFPLLKALALVLRDTVTCAHIPNFARGDKFAAAVAMDAHIAICDASELAKLLTMAGAARGVDIRAYSTTDLLGCGVVRNANQRDLNRRTLNQSQAELLAIMQTPADPSSRERVEMILKGDAS